MASEDAEQPDGADDAADEEPVEGLGPGEDITDIDPPEPEDFPSAASELPDDVDIPDDVDLPDDAGAQELLQAMGEMDDERLISLLERMQEKQNEPVEVSWEDRMLDEDGTETIKVPDGTLTEDGRPVVIPTKVSEPRHMPDADDDNTILAQVQKAARENGEEGIQRWLFNQCVIEPPQLGNENFRRFTKMYRDELSDRLMARMGLQRFFGRLPTTSTLQGIGSESPGESGTESPEPTDEPRKTSESGTPSTSSGQTSPSTKSPPKTG